MIKIQNISKSYKKGNKVIENINLEIKDGEIFGFIGQNGAGKTTTIKMMTGILEIDEGDIFIDGKSISKEPIEAKKTLGLVPDSPDNKIESYSHGMRQKIVIIGVLLHNPKNWILDEPITGLDPKSSFDLKELMKKHASEGNTVFFSTHILEIAEKLCDRIAILNKGKIVFVGTLDELKERYGDKKTLEEIFINIINN